MQGLVPLSPSSGDCIYSVSIMYLFADFLILLVPVDSYILPYPWQRKPRDASTLGYRVTYPWQVVNKPQRAFPCSEFANAPKFHPYVNIKAKRQMQQVEPKMKHTCHIACHATETPPSHQPHSSFWVTSATKQPDLAESNTRSRREVRHKLGVC